MQKREIVMMILSYTHSLLDTINFSTCKNEFMNGRPVYIKGQRIIGNDTIGSHTWVVDGCYVKSFPLYPPHPYFFQIPYNTFIVIGETTEIMTDSIKWMCYCLPIPVYPTLT